MFRPSVRSKLIFFDRVHSPSSIFAFMLPFKAAATPLARSSIVKAMTANQAVARFIASLLPTALRGKQLCLNAL